MCVEENNCYRCDIIMNQSNNQSGILKVEIMVNCEELFLMDEVIS